MIRLKKVWPFLFAWVLPPFGAIVAAQSRRAIVPVRH